MSSEDLEESELTIPDCIYWDGPCCFQGEERFFPRVSLNPLKIINVSGFNAGIVDLDAGMHSSLDWSDAEAKAEALLNMGLQIIWKLDLHLFKEDILSLKHPGKFNSLQFSINHFVERLYKKYSRNTVGMILFQGSLELNQTFFKILDAEDEIRKRLSEQYLEDCQKLRIDPKHSSLSDLNETLKGQQILYSISFDLFFHFMETLSLPTYDLVKSMLLFDLTPYPVSLQLSIVHAERWDKLLLVPKGGTISHEFPIWEGSQASPFGFFSQTQRDIRIQSDEIANIRTGVCLPLLAKMHVGYLDEMEALIQRFDKKVIPYRLVHEAELTSLWDGLDDLFVLGDSITTEGLRKLKGFQAAGGRVVVIGKALNLPSAITLEEWLEENHEFDRDS
jgi:hypothetical protein